MHGQERSAGYAGSGGERQQGVRLCPLPEASQMHREMWRV